VTHRAKDEIVARPIPLHHDLPYAIVLSNTPPDAFSFLASAYSEIIWRRSESPVLASGIESILRPLR
jgi:hypothetical protein